MGSCLEFKVKGRRRGWEGKGRGSVPELNLLLMRAVKKLERKGEENCCDGEVLCQPIILKRLAIDGFERKRKKKKG